MASVTIRIPPEMKAELEEYQVKVSDVIRSALQDEINKARKKRAEEVGETVGKLLAGTTREEIVRLIREGREDR